MYGMTVVITLRISLSTAYIYTLLGLAALLQLYVHAINTGEIPNMQGAWDTYVREKFREAKQTTLKTYDIILSVELTDNLPCDSNDIRLIHNEALLACEDIFITEVVGISTDMVEEQIRQLKVSVTFEFFRAEAAASNEIEIVLLWLVISNTTMILVVLIIIIHHHHQQSHCYGLVAYNVMYNVIVVVMVTVSVIVIVNVIVIEIEEYHVNYHYRLSLLFFLFVISVEIHRK